MVKNECNVIVKERKGDEWDEYPRVQYIYEGTEAEMNALDSSELQDNDWFVCKKKGVFAWDASSEEWQPIKEEA